VGRVIGIWRGPDGGVRTGPPQRDDRFIPVLDLIRRQGLLDRPLLTPRITTADQAEQIRRSIYLAARYYCSCGERLCTRRHPNVPTTENPAGGCPDGGQRLSVRADIVRHPGTGHLHVQLRVFDKRESMREVVRKYGTDPSRWPYQARAKRLKNA
jgi:hypothetical protein